MDSRSFDRLARLMGQATDRRAGLRAALAALVSGGLAADAAAKGKNTEQGRDHRGKDTGRRRDDATPHGGDVDARKKKKPCRAVGATCKKARNCCSGFCLKAVSQGRKKGTCQCLAEGEACSALGACCAGLGCLDGRCRRQPVPTGQACDSGDLCEDEAASCVFYDPQLRGDARGGNGRRGRNRDAREEATRICLLGGGSPCSKDQVCASLSCVEGVCTGPRFVPLGDGCVPGQERCADSRAVCAAYAAGSGGPAGTHCVLPNGDLCDADPECRAFDCNAGFCGREPVDTGDPCDPQRDTCRSAGATCTAYADGSDPQTYCLLRNGQACAAESQCASRDCVDGVCGGTVPVPTGGECDPQADTCAAADASCTTYAGLDDPTTRCLVRTGGACADGADCVTLDCERGVCVEFQPAACDVCPDGCQFSTIADAIEAGLPEVTIQGGVAYAEHDLPGGDRTLELRPCPGTGQPTIDLGGNGRAMEITAGGDVTVVNLRIVDGAVEEADGGGFLVAEGGRLTLVETEIENCRSTAGGAGIAVRGGELEMRGGALRGNVSQSGGGALLLLGARTQLSVVAIEDNLASEGGAIHARPHENFSQQPSLDIEQCTFRRNVATGFGDGGAIRALHHLDMRRSTLAGNTGGNRGGAIFFLISEAGTTTITDCLVQDNVARRGGAIYSQAPGVTISDCLIAGNQAPDTSSGWGGAIYTNTGDMTLHRTRLTGNAAHVGAGAIYNSWGHVLTLVDTEISGNASTLGVGGILNEVKDWDPPVSGTVVCSAPASDACGNAGGNCAGMEDQATCDGVCKEGAC